MSLLYQPEATPFICGCGYAALGDPWCAFRVNGRGRQVIRIRDLPPREVAAVSIDKEMVHEAALAVLPFFTYPVCYPLDSASPRPVAGAARASESLRRPEVAVLPG